MVNITKMAEIVDDAARAGKSIPQLSNKYDYTLEDAYNVQAASFQRRLACGEEQVGMKMGFTSRAKMIQLGLTDPDWGRLSVELLVEDGDEIHFNK